MSARESWGYALPSPGWYLDPTDQSTLRWWTGQQWTSAVATAPAPLWIEARPHRRWVGLGLLAIASAVNYASWLGAHDHFYYNSHGQYRGPYEPWQVIGFISVTVALMIIAGRLHLVLDAAVTVAASVALTFAFFGTRTADPANAWRVTLAILIAAATFCVGWAVTSWTDWLKRHPRSR